MELATVSTYGGLTACGTVAVLGDRCRTLESKIPDTTLIHPLISLPTETRPTVRC